jgi:hypothetical protein
VLQLIVDRKITARQIDPVDSKYPKAFVSMAITHLMLLENRVQ